MQMSTFVYKRFQNYWSSLAADAWMQHAMSHSGSIVTASQTNLANDDPYAEVKKFLNSPLLLCSECPDVIAWWGVSFFFFFDNDFETKNSLVSNSGIGLSSHLNDGQVLCWDHHIFMSFRALVFYFWVY